MKVTFVIPRPLFTDEPRAITVEMDVVPRTGDTVAIDDDYVQGDVAYVIWSVASKGKPGDHEVTVRLR